MSLVDVEGKMFFNQTRIILKKQIMSGYVFFAVECLPKVADEKLKKKNNRFTAIAFAPFDRW